MTVELIYDRGCPNVAEARAELVRAFSDAGLPARWKEWDRADPAAPPHVRAYGSPTVLVDGKDVAGAAPADGASSCRLYSGTDGGFRGAPTSTVIAGALRNAAAKRAGRRSSPGWRGFLVALPGTGAALLPVGACPACWPAYAGVLGSLGLGVLSKDRYLLPLAAAFLLVSVVGLVYKARTRRGYGPFLLGLLASGMVMAGKSASRASLLLYGGAALLLAASAWNAWPRRTAGACPACAPKYGHRS